MKKLISIIPAILILFFATNAIPQDTFSIVAIDPVSGQVGSAGASCIAGSIILSDVHPGRGVIHTQASYLSANQNYARSLMNLGLSPQQIRDSVVAHDAQNNPTVRQYGIVDLIGGGRTAAYTGVNCLNYKNHILGPTYSIQGNILLGQQILDSMQARFLRTTGTLADKMMAALQGAKVVGADTRCTGRNTSSISSFIRMGRTQDTLGILYLNLNVNNTPVGRDPIDSLQILYNNWLTSIKNISTEIPASIELYQNYPNPFNPSTNIKFDIPPDARGETLASRSGQDVRIVIYNALGSEVATLVNDDLDPGTYEVTWYSEGMPSGIYYYNLYTGKNTLTKRMVLIK